MDIWGNRNNFEMAREIDLECLELIGEINEIREEREREDEPIEFLDEEEIGRFERMMADIEDDHGRLGAYAEAALKASERAERLCARVDSRLGDVEAMAATLAAKVAQIENGREGELPKSMALRTRRNPSKDVPVATEMRETARSLLEYILKNMTAYEFQYYENSGPGGVAYECCFLERGRKLLHDLLDGLPPGRVDPDCPFVVKLIKNNLDVLEIADRMARQDFIPPDDATIADARVLAAEWEAELEGAGRGEESRGGADGPDAPRPE